MGLFPCGIVYADRSVEVAGDYKRLAFLSYSSLTLAVERDCPNSLKTTIEHDAAAIYQARRGDSLQIAGNATITLGLARCKATPYCLRNTIEVIHDRTHDVIPACSTCQAKRSTQ